MDPFSDIIALLRPHTAVAKPISGRGRWGISYDAHDAPGFSLILEGRAWIAFEGLAPIEMGAGDFLLLPSTPAFALYSDFDAPRAKQEPTTDAVRHGDPDGDPDFVALGGSFTIERANAPLLLALLPGVIHIRAGERRSERLGQLIALIADECAADDPGKETILRRLLEALLVEAMRRRAVGADADAVGLLHAMRDLPLARVLGAIHADVRARWTVADLARIAGMSRSAFAARFAERLGCGPIEYLARWRMALAKDALIAGQKTLDRIADEIGYESASAFSTAFRKRLGCPPGRFARAGMEES